MFDNPGQRAIALARIGVLRRLADDLAAIVDGRKPSPEDLASAVSIQGTIGQRSVPCLIGQVSNHPRLGNRLITTSQLFMVDPDGRWARTLSRFYRLADDPQVTGREEVLK
ncbi:DUF6634 family protein [Bosea sp. NPDC003192]|uniref:DUF6634 family protein n=1 Tax=Bosea sp. NPDC003192 TaxID=3390551 RepID=UPI003D075DA2